MNFSSHFLSRNAFVVSSFQQEMGSSFLFIFRSTTTLSQHEVQDLQTETSTLFCKRSNCINKFQNVQMTLCQLCPDTHVISGTCVNTHVCSCFSRSARRLASVWRFYIIHHRENVLRNPTQNGHLNIVSLCEPPTKQQRAPAHAETFHFGSIIRFRPPPFGGEVRWPFRIHDPGQSCAPTRTQLTRCIDFFLWKHSSVCQWKVVHKVVWCWYQSFNCCWCLLASWPVNVCTFLEQSGAFFTCRGGRGQTPFPP